MTEGKGIGGKGKGKAGKGESCVMAFGGMDAPDSTVMSFIMLSFQVIRGRPILRDPSGIQLTELSACFARLPSSIRCT